MKGTMVNFKPDHTICCTRYQTFFIPLKQKIHYLNDANIEKRKAAIKSTMILTFSSVSTDCECPRKRSLATKVHVSTQRQTNSLTDLVYHHTNSKRQTSCKLQHFHISLHIICQNYSQVLSVTLKGRWAFTTNNYVGVTHETITE